MEKLRNGMKKLTFGVPEKIVPSAFCKNLRCEETAIDYDTDKISFRQTSRGCVLEFPMSGDEHFYGLGLQLKQFDFTGRHVRLKVNADPVAATGDSHAPVPFFVSTKGYGVYLDTARYVEIDFGRIKKGKSARKNEKSEVKTSTDDLYAVQGVEADAVISVCIPAAKGVDIYIFEGETITDVVSGYNRFSGGGCSVPDWGFGLYYRCFAQYNQQKVLSVAEYFKEKEIPCSVIGFEPGWQTHSYSCSLCWNKDLFPDPESMLKTLYASGYHVNLWEHAFVNGSSPIYDELIDCSANYTVWKGLVPDFTFEKARAVFAKQHIEKVNYGYVDGYKLDECDSSDYTGGWSFPDDTEFPSGADGEQYHCLMGTLYMQTMMSALGEKPTYSEVRNAGALAASYTFVLYSDLYDHKDFIRGVCTAGFSGLLWTPEVRHADTKEEFLRRLQAVVFSSQCLINGWYAEEFPWLKFDCENEVRDLIRLRMKLVPMLIAAFEKYRTEGKPPIRALVSDYTSDTETYNIDDEYIFCDKLIVAPIAAGENKRKVYLPKGKWVDYFTREKAERGWFETESENIPVYEKISD